MTNAAIRFGLGPKPSNTPPADARGWLLDQLGGPDPADFSALPDSAAALAAIEQERAARRLDPTAAKPSHPSGDMLRADATAQLGHAIDTDAPFRERLVWFWANHFTVSTRRGEIAGLIGPYIREAIRPHVTGRFTDMLLAVMRHPAMLIYLDNATSAGPDSLVGQRRHIGLNENLARESLELHTVTPASGYTQADVTRYARILTGWSVRPKADPPGFAFRSELHEPGAQQLLGRTFGPGEQGGIDALEFLGSHPSTYHALALALARHFIADAPPPAAIGRIAASLHRSGGDLAQAAAAVVAEPAAWQPLTKLRTPQDYMIAVLRAADLPHYDRAKLFGTLANLGQPLWSAPLPNGWPDHAADWTDPETLLRRADWSFQIAGQMGDRDPEGLAQTSLGNLLRPATLLAMQHAGSRREAMTLLFTSPEFMRR